jgi:hypothetical protein
MSELSFFGMSMTENLASFLHRSMQAKENIMIKISDNEKTMDFEFVLSEADKAIARFAMEERTKYLMHLNAQDALAQTKHLRNDSISVRHIA